MTLPVPAPEPLPATVIDSHCHLDITVDYSGLTPGDALSAARRVGVGGIIQVGVDVGSSHESVELAHEFDDVMAAVAVHPNEAPSRAATGHLAGDLERLSQLVLDPRVCAVGETGLDHFRTDESGRRDQEASFREHIRLARSSGKALVIHDRDAHSDVLRVLEDEDPPERVVFHCFSGDAAMVRHCAAAGWFMSFADVVTFRNAESLRIALREAPQELLLVETDSPFLTPMPNRGKPNASYLMPATVRGMAEVLGSELEPFCRTLRDNTIRAFDLDPGFGA